MKKYYYKTLDGKTYYITKRPLSEFEMENYVELSEEEIKQLEESVDNK